MIFVDTNIFLRYFTRSTDPDVQEMERLAVRLIDDVESGLETITTSEVVLHEIACVLMSSRHYKLDHHTVADFLRAIVILPGMRLARGEKSLYLRAIEILDNNPGIGMADCLVAARSERLGIPLATFDRRLAKLPGIEIWECAPAVSNPDDNEQTGHES